MPLEACRNFSTTAYSLSRVRFDGSDHSVAGQWAHHPIVVRRYCGERALYADGNEVARHARLWTDEQVCFEPLHYLALPERKPVVFDHALPLMGYLADASDDAVV